MGVCFFFNLTKREEDIGAQNGVIYVDPGNEIIFNQRGRWGILGTWFPFLLLAGWQNLLPGSSRGQEPLQAGPAVGGRGRQGTERQGLGRQPSK